jgi:hypothetical protein
MSLLDSLLWGRKFDESPAKSSPSSPSSPETTAEDRAHSPSCPWNDPRDPYGRRAHNAVDEIGEIPAPEGLMVWLRKNSPFLYRRLSGDLPNRISRAWDARIPYADFDALCSDLVDTSRLAGELYQAAHEE